jgi:hypothetical protein
MDKQEIRLEAVLTYHPNLLRTSEKTLVYQALVDLIHNVYQMTERLRSANA